LGSKTKGRTFPPEIYSREEMKQLITACSHRAPTGIRNRALIVIGYRAGLRITEALALRPKDVDTKNGVVRILKGKGKKARTVGLDPGACAIVDRWLDLRQQLGFNGRQHLLCTLKGEQLKPSYVRTLMPRLGQKAGIDKRVHFHGLRHTFAWELSEEGIPVAKIQKLLGHANLAITGQYLAHIAPHDLIDSIRQREWVLD
jgi:site-specific recombinase XerD